MRDHTRLRRLSRGVGAVPAALAAVVLLTSLGGEALRLAWRYERGAVLAGEWWRLATGHLVHLGWGHALLNLAGTALAAALFAGRLDGRGWSLAAAAAAAAIGAGFLLLEPDLTWYVGLSGVLHGVFVAGALALLLARQAEGALLLVLLAVKLVWEQFYGALPLSEGSAGGPVVVDAHLYGAIGGLLAAAAISRRDWRPRGR